MNKRHIQKCFIEKLWWRRNVPNEMEHVSTYEGGELIVMEVIRPPPGVLCAKMAEVTASLFTSTGFWQCLWQGMHLRRSGWLPLWLPQWFRPDCLLYIMAFQSRKCSNLQRKLSCRCRWMNLSHFRATKPAERSGSASLPSQIFKSCWILFKAPLWLSAMPIHLPVS